MKHFQLLFVLLFVATLGFAQQIDLTHFKRMKPRNLGPAGMSGRVTSIDAVRANPDVIYIGTASGGLWKTTSGGIHWQPLFDEQPLLSIGAVAIDQNNPDVVWAGTGEGNPRNSQTSGDGIYKSVDGGKSWELMGLVGTKTIHRIVIHRDNPDIVLVGALGSAWGSNQDRGVFRTTDGGKNWEKVLYINDQTGCSDLIVDPSNPNKLFAGMWEYGRKPWTFNSGGDGSGLYVSHDGGKNWKKRTEANGLPKGKLGRIGLTLCHSRPNIVYALVEAKKTGLYRSDDGGLNWHKQADKNIGNRPFYYCDIYCDPQNENRIYNLHSVITISEDGGKTFSTFADWNHIHPDHHAFYIHPDNPDFLMEGNDGGMSISRDRGKTWRFVENLPLAQFYHINIDNDVPYHVYGGMQDNGSWKGPSQVWRMGGIRNSDWQELVFGDGFDVVPDPKDSRYGYAMYQGGNVYRYDSKTGRNEYIQPQPPKDTRLRFNWNAGIVQDPFIESGLYFGSQFVHHTSDQGKTWRIISPDLTTNDPDKQKQAESGGLTIDATKAENYTAILSISPSPLERGVIWVGTDDGHLQLTKDGGQTWNKLNGKLPGAPKGAWFPQIEVSQHKAGEAFIVLNNYRRNDWKPYLYHTSDYGATFTRIADDRNVKGYCLSVKQDLVEPDLVFLGTENGLWVSFDHGKNWQQWKHGYPAASTMDLKIHPREHDLVIGTFGRAAWILDDIRPLRELAQQGPSLLEQPLHVFETPVAYNAEYRSVEGTRFAADAHFKGTNRSRGAMISFWINPDILAFKDEPTDSGAKAPKKTDNKLHMSVISASGDTMRTYKMKPDTGLHRLPWRLSRNWVRYPTHREIKKDANLPGGPRVLPGEYKVVIQFREHKDSTALTIKPDPRLPISQEDLLAKEPYLQEIKSIIDAAFKGFERMKDAEKTISKVNGLLDQLSEADQDSLKKAGKAISDQLSELKKEFTTTSDFQGYDHYTIRINDQLGNAEEYINSSDGEPGANAKQALAEVKKRVSDVLVKINTIFAEEWPAYQKQVEAARPTVFKKYEKIEMK